MLAAQPVLAQPTVYQPLAPLRTSKASYASSENGLLNILAMLGLGANGPVLAHFHHVFGAQNGNVGPIRELLAGNPNHPEARKEVEAMDMAMLNQLRESRELIDSSPEIQGRTGLFIDSTVQTMQADYLELVHDLVDINSLNLSDPAAVMNLNAFIEKYAGVPDALSFNDVRGSLNVIIDALNFKDTWLVQFDPNKTFLDDFHTLARGTMKIPTMNKKYDELLVANRGGVVGVSIPFTNGARAEFVMGLEHEDDLAFTDYYPTKDVQLFLPKFHHEQELDLEEYLRENGLEALLAPGSLERIYPGARVGKIKQKIDLVVDEEGAELKVYTYAMVPLAIGMGPKGLIIKFDQPFHYQIVKDSNVLVTGYFDA